MPKKGKKKQIAEQEPVTYRPLFHADFKVFDGIGNAIGHIHVYRHLCGLYVSDLWVHPDHRKRGMAKTLWNDAFAQFGTEDLYLEVSGFTNVPMEDAILVKFYERLGFVMTAVYGVMFRRGRKP